MTDARKLLIAVTCGVVAAFVDVHSQSAVSGGGLDPANILKPLGDSWSTYSGDYSGKRYSTLTQINQATVKNLTLAWTTRLTAGSGGGGGGGRGGGGGAAVIVGGEGTGDFGAGQAANIKGAILQVNGILYVSVPDNAWAIDARDGREIWHYHWKTRGGTHIGNRGLGMWNDYLFMETPDNYLVSLDARTGKERWHKVISLSRNIFRRWRRSSSATTCWWARETISMLRGSCSRSIRKPARCSGSCTPCR
jgi:alcohol dehydrogenase (cytochrome c)